MGDWLVDQVRDNFKLIEDNECPVCYGTEFGVTLSPVGYRVDLLLEESYSEIDDMSEVETVTCIQCGHSLERR